jgi:hypothetical protein
VNHRHEQPFADGWPVSARVCTVVAKEAAMSETFRAFMYGLLILITALIPPVISLMRQFNG